MDPLSFLGVLLGLAAILGGNWLEGGHIESLTNGPALVIVLGGTIGAMLLQTPLSIFLRAMRMMGSVFIPPRRPLVVAIEKIVLWSSSSRPDFNQIMSRYEMLRISVKLLIVLILLLF